MIETSLDPVFIAGQTAIGKSAVALQLAVKINGEIITVDSMQVYRGLDIGTAKPSTEERQRVPHHLLDVVELSSTFDAARFRELAKAAVQDIQSRKRVPIFCGGTGLYFKAFVGGLGSAPPSNPDLRKQLEAMPISELLHELEENDPATFERVDRMNPRRVIRAVEVLRLTGRPPSEQRDDWSKSKTPPRFFALNRDSGDLRRRIETRVDRMFERGLVAETQSLISAGLAQNRTAMQALGYRQVVEHLEGTRSLEETIQLVKTRTWQFARRQMTWLRRHLQPQWLHLTHESQAADTAALIVSRL